MKNNPPELTDSTDSQKSLTRRRALKRFNHFAIASSTTYLAMAVNYQKPSLKKMLNMTDSAAQATSTGAEEGDITPP